MFIPLGDDNSKIRTTPYVVWTLFAVNVATWFLQLQLGDSFTLGYSAVPQEISKGIDLVGNKMLSVSGTTTSIEHWPGPSLIYLTLITSMFMHGSWMHIIGNMTYLLIFGDQIEDYLGHLKFFIFYLICGIAAGFAQIFMDSDSIIPCLGASGAIAGVLGAYLIKHPGNRVKVLVGRMLTHLPASIVLGGWIVLQLVAQVSVTGHSGVAYMAHIGGFVGGVLLIMALPAKAYRVRTN